jgi:rhomboid family GlyGly-CTERM serine protease
VGFPLPLTLGAAAALAAALPAAALEYRRAAVARGELWRLITCHWVHWSADHLRWDLLALLALAWVCQAQWRQATAALAAATLAIPLAVAVLQPGLSSYRGLSGLCSTLFVLAACNLLAGPDAPGERAPGDRAARGGALVSRLAGALALLLFGGKLVWELSTGNALFVDGAAAGFQPVPLAHLVGGLCGAAAFRAWRRRP